MVVEEREYEIRQQAEIENASLAESLPNLTWMLLLNKGMLSHEPKGEKSKTIIQKLKSNQYLALFGPNLWTRLFR
jgi:hypothetical protein